MPDLVEARKQVVELMHAVIVPGRVAGTTVKTIKYNEHRDVVSGTVTRFAERKWLNAAGYSWEVRERGPHGRRTEYIWWLEDAVGQEVEWAAGTLVARTVTGNFHHTTFEVVADTHVVTIEGLALS